MERDVAKVREELVTAWWCADAALRTAEAAVVARQTECDRLVQRMLDSGMTALEVADIVDGARAIADATYAMALASRRSHTSVDAGDQV